jgi:hypothetical protein
MRRKEAGFVAAQAAILVGVIALVALPALSTNEQQVLTSSAVAGSVAFTSRVSPQGIQLEVTLNSSSVQSHGAISARVEAFNTLDRNVSLSGLVQNQNISEWSGDDYVCDSPSTIVGFALFRGHFAAGNISAAGQPLQLAPPEVIYGCEGASGSGQVGAVTFLPEGDQAVATDDFQGIYEGSYPVTVSVNATTGDCGDNPELVGFCTGKGLSGYWNDSIPAPGALNFTSPAFAFFPPGEYTIAATDLWDQYVYATFAVEPSPQTTTFTSNTTSSTCSNVVNLNGTDYCALNVTNSTQFAVPGYAVMNAPVRFMGVLFETVCPTTFEECQNQTFITLGELRMNLIFPDGTNQTISTYFPDNFGQPTYVLSPSSAVPRAGFSLEFVNTGVGGENPVATFLLLVQDSQP